MALAEKIVDARELEAPLPLEQAVKTAKNLREGEYLKMIHRMRPCKLEPILQKIGVENVYFEHNGVHFVFGWLKTDSNTKREILERIKNEYSRTFII